MIVARLSYSTTRVAIMAIIFVVVCLQLKQLNDFSNCSDLIARHSSKDDVRKYNFHASNNVKADLYRRVQQMELKANKILEEDKQKALLPSKDITKVHYKVSEFQLALGHSSTFHFSIHSTNSSGIVLNESQYHIVDQILCEAPVKVIPHFAQAAFPCWSVFQLFPKAERFLDINLRHENIQSEWVFDLIQTYKNEGIKIIDRKIKWERSYKQPTWKVALEPPASGWQVKRDDESYFEQGNPSYFLKMSDIQILQKRVLDNYFRSHTEISLPICVLIVERKGYSREWVYTNETASQILSIWGADGSVETRILPNPKGPLQNQALEFHKADIIISPHGQQLKNLAFIRPCTAVLEFFPMNYYLAFFQPYVLSAGGLSFDGYPFGREKLYDSKHTGDVGAVLREKIRGTPILASSSSVLRAFPRLVLDNLSCRRSLNKNQEQLLK
jgi:hypothetical protein